MNPAGRVEIIVNPVSGRSGSAGLLTTLIRELRRSGLRHRLSHTAGPGDAGRLAAEAGDQGAAALIIVGGDGTVREAVAGLSNEPTAPPILVVPAGTENILAKHLGLTADAARLTQVLLAGRTLEFDVPTHNGRPFLLVGGVGFDAHVVRRLATGRRGHIGYDDYFWPLWRTFWSYRHPELRVSVDGRTVFSGRGMAFVANVSRYAIGLRLLPEARPNDGRLDLCVFPCTNPGRLLVHAARVVLGRHGSGGGCVFARGRAVVIAGGESAEVEVDGEIAPGLPARFEVGGRKVRFLTLAPVSCF